MVYGYTVAPYGNICARTGSVVIISGDPLEIGLECGTTTTTTTTSTTTTTTTTPAPTCNLYFNFSDNDWIGDYQDCEGVWQYGATVSAYGNICARTGSVTTISGTPLEIGSSCAV